MAFTEDKSEVVRGRCAIGQALKWGVSGVSTEFSPVLMGIVAFVAQTTLAVALTVALGVASFSWLSQNLSDLFSQLTGVEETVSSGPSWMHVALALLATSVSSGLLLLLLRGLWVGALVRRLVRKNARALQQSVSAKDSDVPSSTSAESVASSEKDDGEKGALLEGWEALPRLLKLLGVFVWVAIATLAICGTLVIVSCLISRAFLSAMVFGGASLMVKLLFGWLLTFAGLFVVAIALGTFCLFRLSVVRVLALDEHPASAVVAAAKSLVVNVDFYAAVFGVFTVAAGVGCAGKYFVTWVPDFIVDASAPLFIAAAFFGLVLALGGAAFRACVVSAEYGALTAGVLSDAGQWAQVTNGPTAVEPPPQTGDLILSTHVAAEAVSQTSDASDVVETSLVLNTVVVAPEPSEVILQTRPVMPSESPPEPPSEMTPEQADADAHEATDVAASSESAEPTDSPTQEA